MESRISRNLRKHRQRAGIAVDESRAWGMSRRRARFAVRALVRAERRVARLFCSGAMGGE